MKITAAQIIPYHGTLPRAIETSHGCYHERAGLLLVVRDELGNYGVGDAAPFPGLSTDTLEECGKALHRLTVPTRLIPMSAQEYFFEKGFCARESAPLLEEMELQFSTEPGYFRPPSAAALFAAATALGELKSKRKNLSLSRAMCENSANSVPVNGLISDLRAEEVSRQALSLESAGFSSLKMKVGIDHPGHDVERICAVCDATPTARLRIDANCGWDVKWAETVLSNVPRSHIEFIEQPFPRGQYAEAGRIAAKYHVRLALDEDVQTLEEAEIHIKRRTCDVLVIKPMIVGRLYQCVLLAHKAQAAGIEVIYTSSWESDIGIAATLHLAAALGPNPPAMGLSTAGMIAEGIVKKPLRIEDGCLKVPDVPGLGMELAPELLERMK